jgi:hypothetical protein
VLFRSLAQDKAAWMGGFFIGMVGSPSAAISSKAILPWQCLNDSRDNLFVKAFEEPVGVPAHNAAMMVSPVSPDSDRPKAFHFTLERM